MIEIHIKNMVCARCIKTVTGIFQKVDAMPKTVRLGNVEIDKELTEDQERKIRKALEADGFEWLDDQKVKLVEQVKQIIVQLVHYSELDEMKENLSGYLSSKMHKDYYYLSSLFSAFENTTIEQYFILQKIEKVKEWLVYDEFTLSEMAFKLGYSSVAHLSGQFKKVTVYAQPV